MWLTVSSLLVGLSVFFLLPARYSAEVVFILKNPLYSDRNYLFNNETKFIDYFASDDDVDRLMTMCRSDSVQDKVISTFDLAEKYDYDITEPKQVVKLHKFFNKNLNIYRTDGKNVVLSYTDKDMKRALAIAKMSLKESEQALRKFYVNMRNDMYQSVMNKVKEEDSMVRLLTDSLSVLRTKYGIYDIISPSRYNIMLSSFKENGREDYGRGIEEIQNLESVKDEIVTDKARHITLANQYATGNSFNEMPLTDIVNVSRLPLKPKGLGIVGVIAICIFSGVFFSILYILSMDFYRSIGSNR